MNDAASTVPGLLVSGTAGADVLYGQDGNDLLQGREGDDTLYGGLGIDTAVYAGPQSAYRVWSPLLGVWTLTDLLAADGDEGGDTLVDIEKLRFSDSDLQLFDVGEFQVNRWTFDHQGEPAVAALTGGGWVAGWTSYGQDGDGQGVYAQRFDGSGAAVGDEFQLSVTSTGEQRDVALAGLSSGGFVSVWTGAGEGGLTQVYARRHDASGSSASGEIALDAGQMVFQSQPAVAALPGGGFVAAWLATAHGLNAVMARQFAADGSALGPASRVDAGLAPVYGEVDVVARADGRFMVLWSTAGDPGGEQAALRAFSAAGIPLGTDRLLAEASSIGKVAPSAAVLDGGGFVATWTEYAPSDGHASLYAQRLDGEGSPVGGTVLVAQGAPYATLQDPAVAALPGGGFLVAWAQGESDGSFHVMQRRYTGEGLAAGDALRASSDVEHWKSVPVAARLGDGGTVILWQSEQQDTSLFGSYGNGGIFGQRFDAVGNPQTAFPPSSLLGTEVDDRLVGTALAERLVALGGDDTLSGGAGEDTLDGGAGFDQARWDGILADHVFSNRPLGSAAYVSDPGRSWTDTLVDIERAVFSDASVGLSHAGEYLLASGGTFSQFPGATDPALARLADGRLMAAWTGSDGSRQGVFGQLLSPDGAPQGEVFQVAATTYLAQASPSVAGLAGGGFVVTWDSEQDGSESGIYARRFDAAGVPLGGEFRVNTWTHSDQLESVVAALADGGFLVAWHSYGQDGSAFGVHAQRFSANGGAVGGEFRVNETTAGNQALAGIAALPDGGWVVTWMSELAGAWPEDRDIYVRRYGSDGKPLSGEMLVNTWTTEDQGFPGVAALAGGGFVVVWHSQPQDGDGYGIYAQRFDSAAQPLGQEFRVNTATALPQLLPTVTALDDGGFVVSWATGYTWYEGGPDQMDLYGKRFDAGGQAVGEEFRINTFDLRDQARAALVPLDDGGFLAAWGSIGEDLASLVLLAKRFLPDGSEYNVLTVTADDGGRVLRGGEGLQALVGGAGADRFETGPGDDTVQGGGGIDTVVFAGLQAEYTVARNGTVAQVSGDPASAGSDTLFDVERLAWDDLAIGWDLDGVAGHAYRLYKAAFDRIPDLPGLGYWIARLDAGARMLDVASGFLASEEFRDLYGQDPDNAAYTLALYLNVLDREPDADGYAYWNARLSGEPWEGVWHGTVTREQMLIDFSESPENKANVIGLIADGVSYQPW